MRMLGLFLILAFLSGPVCTAGPERDARAIASVQGALPVRTVGEERG